MGVTKNICIAKGDGIGPEIMDATLQILEAAKAELNITEIEVGEKLFLKGLSSGIEPTTWDVLKANKILLKAPITTPQGGGYKSLNVTIRKTLGLFANVRPAVAYHPFVETLFPELDVVVVRENEEDLYAGIEYQQTKDVTAAIKIISRQGSEKIIRYAFEYARANNRKKVSCFIKDNIMKISDGLFHKIFKEVAKEYSDIQTDSWIVDIGTARLATDPGRFDVIVTENLYGDIISDITAEISGSVGLGASANIGDNFAMFEAIHGSAPDIAGKGIANPSGLLLAAVQMLVHLNQKEVATKIHNAWLKTIEDGVHTGDIYKEGVSRQRVNTKEFTAAVIERLGQVPNLFKPVFYDPAVDSSFDSSKLVSPIADVDKKLVGIDVFLDVDPAKKSVAQIAEELQKSLTTDKFKLTVISNKGAKVWPGAYPEDMLCTNSWRCRFEGNEVSNADVVTLLGNVHAAGLDFVKTEHLYTFNGVVGYSLSQGE